QARVAAAIAPADPPLVSRPPRRQYIAPRSRRRPRDQPRRLSQFGGSATASSLVANVGFVGDRAAPTAPVEFKPSPFGHAAAQVVTLDVIGQRVTLSEREAEELRRAAAADAGRSSARRDLSLLLERGLRTKATVAI